MRREAVILESNVCGCGTLETRTSYFLGLELNVDFGYAKRGKFVEGKTTKSFFEFLRKAENKENIVDCGLPLVYVNDIYYSTGLIRGGEMSMKINDYLIKEHNLDNLKDVKNFYDKYFPFITACRKVARNVIKAPKVRVSFETTLKNESEIYDNFIKYLKEKADN